LKSFSPIPLFLLLGLLLFPACGLGLRRFLPSTADVTAEPTPTATPEGGGGGDGDGDGNLYVYASSFSGSYITAYRVDASTGALNIKASYSIVGAFDQPDQMIASPSGRCLFVGESSSASIFSFIIQSDGALLAAQEMNLAAAAGPFAISPDGAYLYTTLYSTDKVAWFSVSSGCILSYQGEANTFVGPSSLVYDPTGSFLIVGARGEMRLQPFRIGLNGSLTAGSGQGAGTPFDMVMHPTSARIYSANENVLLDIHHLDAGTDSISQESISPQNISVNFSRIAMDPFGEFVFLGKTGANELEMRSIDFDGSTSSIVSVNIGGGASGVTCDALGRWVFAVSDSGNQITSARIDRPFGLSPSLVLVDSKAIDDPRDVIAVQK